MPDGCLKSAWVLAMMLLVILGSGCMEPHQAGGQSPLTPAATGGPDAPPVNSAPVIISEPVTRSRQGEVYLYRAAAVDAEADVLAWSLEAAPAGLLIDPETGVVLASGLSAGSHPVTIRVTDAVTGTAAQSYMLTVEGGPRITSSAAEYTVSSTQYRYAARAVDPDGHALRYSLGDGPAGMVLDPDSGLLEWTAGAAGEYPVELTAANALGGTAVQTFTIRVVAPGGTIIISRPVVEGFESMPYEYRLSVLGVEQAILNYSLNDSPPGMTIDTGGVIRWVPGSAGVFPVEVTLTNDRGYVDAQTYVIQVYALEEMDGRFNGMLDGLFRDIGRGDVQAAAAWLTPGARSRLIPLLQDLAPYMDEVSANYTGAVRLSLDTDAAEYVVRRTGSAGTKVFMVTFLRGFDGGWRIDDL